MKTILKISGLLCLVMLSQALFSQERWEKITVPSRQFLRSVCFTDSLYGWVAGDSGTILHTSNGGKDWIIQETNTLNDVMAVFFLDRQKGWAAAWNFSVHPYGTVLLKTTDGGSVWIPVSYPDSNIFMNCILYFDSLTGWMGGEPHAIVKTTDGGTTWTQAVIESSVLAFFPVINITFYDRKHGWASGGMFDIAGVIWRTHDGGDTWYAMDPAQAPADEVYGIHPFDSLNVLAAGGDQDFGYGVGMLRTHDGGTNWDYSELGIQGNAFDLDFRTETDAWAPLGQRLQLIRSKDAGNTWTAVPTPDSTAIYKMTFPDSLHGYAVGKNGAFIKYFPDHSGGIAPDQQLPYGRSVIVKSDPNPCTANTTVKILSSPSVLPLTDCRISIYSVTGNKVYGLTLGKITTEVFNKVIDLSGLPKGMYVLRFSANGRGGETIFSEPVKMMISR